MARPHIEFIHAQQIPWTASVPGGIRSGVSSRVLSEDEDDGACTLQLRYPSGWRQDATEVLTVDEGLLVLDGAMEIGGRRFGRYDYAHLPAGYAREGLATSSGAAVMTFFSAMPALAGAAREFDERRLVEHLETRTMGGNAGARKDMSSEGFNFSGTEHKTLFLDPDTGERTWLISLAPGWYSTLTEVHPVIEEEFAISGELAMPNGIMHAGAYFWRPAGVEHGPFGTVGGTLHLCRCVGGPFSVEFDERPDLLNWEPRYEPVLPEFMQPWVESGPPGGSF